MNSQNTPIHIRLWHHDFWRMAIANLLLTMAVYMLVPTMPLWLISQGFSWTETGIAMGACFRGRAVCIRWLCVVLGTALPP